MINKRFSFLLIGLLCSSVGSAYSMESSGSASLFTLAGAAAAGAVGYAVSGKLMASPQTQEEQVKQALAVLANPAHFCAISKAKNELDQAQRDIIATALGLPTQQKVNGLLIDARTQAFAEGIEHERAHPGTDLKETVDQYRTGLAEKIAQRKA